MKRLIAAVALTLAATGALAAGRALDACYVRPDAPEPAAVAASAAPTRGHLGLRRKSDQLFEVDISVAGPDLATCSVSGVAKLRGEPGSETLGLVIRPDPARKAGRSGTLCQVFVHLTPDAVELRTTATSCQAHGLCEGKVDLHGQRFEHTAKLPAGTSGPCFARGSP